MPVAIVAIVAIAAEILFCVRFSGARNDEHGAREELDLRASHETHELTRGNGIRTMKS